MDDRSFRNVMGKFATGITVVTTEIEGHVFGMTANAFMSVSLNPKLIVVSIDKKARMLCRIQETGQFAISFLNQQQQEESKRFAGQINGDSPFQFERFAEMPVIKDALAALACRLYKEVEAGDHVLFIGEVTDMREGAGEPLIYFSGKYRKLDNQES